MFQQNNNSFNGQQNRYVDESSRARAVEMMARASMACAILGLFSSMMGIGFVFGAIAVALGLLSRGSQMPRTFKAAKRGIIFGLIAVVLSAVILLSSFRTLISEYGSLSNYYDAYMEYYEEYLE